MTVTLIAALDERGMIGLAGGGLPWHVPEETAHFRAFCASRWLLVGRQTYAEMAGWFQPDQHVVVLTRESFIAASGETARPGSLRTAPSVSSALDLARDGGASELVVLGGARTYAAALPWARCLVLSRIGLRSEGTVAFPSVDWTAWRLTRSEPRRTDRETGISFTIEYWERR